VKGERGDGRNKESGMRWEEGERSQGGLNWKEMGGGGGWRGREAIGGGVQGDRSKGRDVGVLIKLGLGRRI